MSYLSTAPFWLTYSGLCSGAGAAVDLFTFTMPNSGQRYIVNQMILENLGTGNLGATALEVNGYMAAGGNGGPIFSALTAGSLNSGAAVSLNPTVTGSFGGPNLVLRQTLSPGFSTAFGISVYIVPVP